MVIVRAGKGRNEKSKGGSLRVCFLYIVIAPGF